jgi:hypothetical protein
MWFGNANLTEPESGQQASLSSLKIASFANTNIICRNVDIYKLLVHSVPVDEVPVPN